MPGVPGTPPLRAAVLGANDGLVSNLSVVMGVAGAAAGGALSAEAIVFAGLAGLLAFGLGAAALTYGIAPCWASPSAGS